MQVARWWHRPFDYCKKHPLAGFVVWLIPGLLVAVDWLGRAQEAVGLFATLWTGVVFAGVWTCLPLGLLMLLVAHSDKLRNKFSAARPSFSIKLGSAPMFTGGTKSWARIGIRNEAGRVLRGCRVRLKAWHWPPFQPPTTGESLLVETVDQMFPPRFLRWTHSRAVAFDLPHDQAFHDVDFVVAEEEAETCLLIGCDPPSSQGIGEGCCAFDIAVSSDDEKAIPLTQRILLTFHKKTRPRNGVLEIVHTIRLEPFVARDELKTLQAAAFYDYVIGEQLAPYAHLRDAVGRLVRAYDYSRKPGVQRFQFWVPLAELEQVGASRTDLLHMSQLGLIEYGDCWQTPGMDGVGVQKMNHFTDATRVGLTEAGYAWASTESFEPSR